MAMTRVAPPLTERTGDYWRSGADGVLRIVRCQDCGWRLHPPRPLCPKCRGRDIAFEPVSGKGVVYSCTINRYQWQPGMTPPYVLAEIELVEQEGLRILSNVIGCAPEEVRIGMPVSVTFEQAEDAYIPVFRP
jgi:uncharacterized OB-fold protein